MTETDTTVEIRVNPTEWDAHVPAPGHPQIVVGGPGTGKTEFLCRRIIDALANGAPPSSIVVLTFSRLSVNDIRTRLFNAVGSLSYQIQVATYHSIANRIVESNHVALGFRDPPTVLAGPEHERFVLSVLEEEDPANWREMYRGIIATQAMASELTDFILRFHEQVNTIADLDRSAVPEWKGLAAFLARYNAELDASGRIDYGRLLNEALMLIETDPSIAGTYEHVFADEFQDTSPVQARILFGLASHSQSLTVAGDPYQSIYSFRGTDLHNVLDFPKNAERALGAEADRLVLTTSFRVPREILDAAVNVTGRALPGAAGKVESIRERGTVDTHVFESPDSESEWIASDIERIHLVDGINLNRIAVFTRAGGAFQQRLAASLERRSIQHSLVLEQLEDQPVVRFVYDLVATAIASDTSDVNEYIRSILLGAFMAVPSGLVNDAGGRAEDRAGWVEQLESKMPMASLLVGLLSDTSWADSIPARQGLWHLWKTLPQLHAIATDDELLSDRRAWAAFFQAVARFNDRVPNGTLRDHQILASTSDIEADALFSFRSGLGQGVTIATLHRAKGTEYDVVYVAHAVEGLLPDLRTKDSLLKTRLLNPHLPEDPGGYVQFRLNEERRLAYTAMTRATDRVVWTATELDSPSEQLEPSRFLAQVAPPSKPTTITRPLTHRSFEAMLRRTLADPFADDADRLAALRILANGPLHGFADQSIRYGTAKRGSMVGFVQPDHRTSPSQANAYDECPRRYALERFGTQREAASVYLTFGNLIHKVLELAELEAMDAGIVHADLGRAKAILAELWDEIGFGSDGVGNAWFRRSVGVLETLYDKWPTSAEPVAVEVNLDLDLDGTAWRGKVDRVEMAAGSLTVVDYKTSKTATTIDDANQSLQLGFYVLAVTADPELSALGSVSGAQFWFPSPKPTKTSIVTRSFDMANIEIVRERLVEIAHSIQSEMFGPVVGTYCGRCDFATVCPARKEGREAFAT